MEDVTMEQVGAALARALVRVAALEAALPDPDKLVWLASWLDKVNAVVTAYAEHHDEACGVVYAPDNPCGDLGAGEKRDRLLEFMDHKVQGDLLEWARRIKEVAYGGQDLQG